MSDVEVMLGLQERLSILVFKKFLEAYKAKDIIFSDTSLAILRSQEGVSFQLRYCPALAKKPTTAEPDTNKAPKKPMFDPFADPSPELLIADIPGTIASHVLVLNKFPVIHNHFIIATKTNKPQTAVLEEGDIGMTYACLRAWDDQKLPGRPGRLFSFFNSGEHSGASQPHRHLQFLPQEDMMQDERDFDLLIDHMTVPAHPELPLYHNPSLPLLHFATPLEDGLSSSALHSKYVMLLKAALSAARNPGQPYDENIRVEKEKTTVFSYNLAMTAERMAICPRSKEGAPIPGAGADSFVAVNGTLLGGTLMVRDEKEWNALRNDPSLLKGLFSSLGFPPISWSNSSRKSPQNIPVRM